MRTHKAPHNIYRRNNQKPFCLLPENGEKVASLRKQYLHPTKTSNNWYGFQWTNKALFKFNANICSPEIILEDFNPENRLEWQIINDGVMGGLSEGLFRINSDQTADFQGNVSLENNGGFASVRALLKEASSGSFQKIVVRARGDGKTYSFRIRTDSNFDGIAYACNFRTIKDEWTEYEFIPNNFIPTFRGRILSNVVPLKETQIKQIGFLIAEKQSGIFALKIDWIKLIP